MKIKLSDAVKLRGKQRRGINMNKNSNLLLILPKQNPSYESISVLYKKCDVPFFLSLQTLRRWFTVVI